LWNIKIETFNIFLANFIDELKVLLENGLNFKGNLFKIEIHSFVCDASARNAFLKCTKIQIIRHAIKVLNPENIIKIKLFL